MGSFSEMAHVRGERLLDEAVRLLEAEETPTREVVRAATRKVKVAANCVAPRGGGPLPYPDLGPTLDSDGEPIPTGPDPGEDVT